jgi:hypothetical protein
MSHLIFISWKIIYILDCSYSKVLQNTVRALWNKAYQVGMHDEARTFAMKDHNNIAEIHCQNEHKHSLPAVKNIQAAVSKKSSQQQNRPKVQNTKQLKKNREG